MADSKELRAQDTQIYVVGLKNQSDLAPLFNPPDSDLEEVFSLEIQRNNLNDRQLTLNVVRPEKCVDTYEVTWKKGSPIEAALLRSNCSSQSPITPLSQIDPKKQIALLETLKKLDSFVPFNEENLRKKVETLTKLYGQKQAENFEALIDPVYDPLIQLWVTVKRLPPEKQKAFETWRKEFGARIRQYPPQTPVNPDTPSPIEAIYQNAQSLEDLSFQAFQTKHIVPQLTENDLPIWQWFFTFEAKFSVDLEKYSDRFDTLARDGNAADILHGHILLNTPVVPKEMYHALLKMHTMWLIRSNNYQPKEPMTMSDEDIHQQLLALGITGVFSDEVEYFLSKTVREKIVDSQTTAGEMEALEAAYVAAIFPTLRFLDEGYHSQGPITRHESRIWQTSFRKIFEQRLVRDKLPELLQENPSKLVMRRIRAMSQLDAQGLIDWKTVMADVAAPKPKDKKQPVAFITPPPVSIPPAKPMALSKIPPEVWLLGGVGVLAATSGTVYKHNVTPYWDGRQETVERGIFGLAGASLTPALLLGVASLFNRQWAEKNKWWLLGGGAAAGAAMGTLGLSPMIPGNGPRQAPTQRPDHEVPADDDDVGPSPRYYFTPSRPSIRVVPTGGGSTEEPEDTRHPSGEAG